MSTRPREIKTKNAEKIKIKNFDQENVSEAKRIFISHYDSLKKLNEFAAFIKDDLSLKNVSEKEELEQLTSLIQGLLNKLKKETSDLFITWKQGDIFNKAVIKINQEVSKKSGVPAKPSATGLLSYAKNRIGIEGDIRKILQNLNKEIVYPDEYVGFLGEGKGDLYCRTNVLFQLGNIVDAKFTPIAKIKKIPQREFANNINIISKHTYKNDLFEKIAELNKIDQIEDITSLHRLLLFSRIFVVNNEFYQPSSGESSMLLLHKELEADKDVYIFDEPEKSLGNDYISDVIVPLINEKAKQGKRIFISTHDANIAVRTLPYNSIYRFHGASGYKTYVGNPFTNNLLNIEDEKDQIDWKQISMKTLEGGKEAFGERGKIYGNL